MSIISWLKHQTLKTTTGGLPCKHTSSPIEVNSLQEFKSLGLTSFFDTNEENNVDWEEMFDVKSL